MKIKATTPCYKFVDTCSSTQVVKLFEEAAEVLEALKEYWQNKQSEKAFNNLLIELLDVQACASTFIYQLVTNHPQGAVAGEKALKAAKRTVIAKNMARGYYLTPELDRKSKDNENESLDKEMRVLISPALRDKLRNDPEKAQRFKKLIQIDENIPF